MTEMSKNEVVRVLVNLDVMAAGSASPKRRAWAHLFIACGLIQKELPNPEQLTRERFMALAGKVHDSIYGALASEEGPRA
jgi:hypothetical protein